MKSILTLLAAAAVLGFAAPSTANADHACGSRRIISYRACGAPIYAVYQIVGYDRCGHPVGQWVTQNVAHSCGTCNPRPSYGSHSGHNHGHSGYRPGYSQSRSGLSFRFGFGR